MHAIEVVAIFDSLQESLGILVAAALGGALAIAGSVIVQRATIRQQQLQQRTDVYRGVLEAVHRNLQVVQGHARIVQLKEYMALLGDAAMKRRQALNDGSPAALRDGITDIARWLVAEFDKVNKVIDEEVSFIEPPEVLIPEIRTAYRLQAEWSLYLSPLVISQLNLARYYGSPKHVELPRLRREVKRLEGVIRRELSWSGRNLLWRALLKAYSASVRLRNWRSFRRIRSDASHR